MTNAIQIERALREHALWVKTDGRIGGRADLRDTDISGMDMSGVDLQGAALNGIIAHDVDFRGANLNGADLSHGDFTGSNFREAKLYKTSLIQADLTNTIMVEADLERADLQDSRLRNANLNYASLRQAYLVGADLNWTKMKGIQGDETHIKTISCGQPYPIAYTSDSMQVGDAAHPIDVWWRFGYPEIVSMFGEGGDHFWNTWRPVIQQIIAITPAEPTGWKSSQS